MRCLRCGDRIENEDRYIEANENIIDETIAGMMLLQSASGRGTYHVDCWPGLVHRVDDRFDSEAQQSANVSDESTRRSQTRTDVSDHPATDPIVECDRCGEVMNDEVMNEGDRFIFLAKFKHHAIESGFFVSIKRMLTTDFSPNTDELIEEGGIYHTDCWPGLAHGVESPLDLWTNQNSA